MDLPNGIERTPTGSEAVGTVVEVRFEDRLDDEFGGRLHHPVSDGGDSQRPLAYSARLWNHHHTTHGLRPVASCP
jgi:hypothetical protein